MVYLFKIKLKGITKPPVWRKVSVPENFTFLQFHQVIQTIFGWCGYHLFEFKDKEYPSSFLAKTISISSLKHTMPQRPSCQKSFQKM